MILQVKKTFINHGKNSFPKTKTQNWTKHSKNHNPTQVQLSPRLLCFLLHSISRASRQNQDTWKENKKSHSTKFIFRCGLNDGTNLHIAGHLPDVFPSLPIKWVSGAVALNKFRWFISAPSRMAVYNLVFSLLAFLFYSLLKMWIEWEKRVSEIAVHSWIFIPRATIIALRDHTSSHPSAVSRVWCGVAMSRTWWHGVEWFGHGC